MLEDSLFESRGRQKTRNPMIVAVSALAHVVTIIALALIPLLETQALTIPPIDTSLILPRIERTQSVQVFRAPRQVLTRTETNTQSPVLTEPLSIPQRIVFVDEPLQRELSSLPLHIGAGTGVPEGGVGNRGVEITAPVVTLPLPPPPPAVDAHPIRVSSKPQAATLIYEVKPTYPPLARLARIQGVVILEALINKEGLIESLRVISGHELLTRAALDAVRQWKYRPTMLNGEPVDVITTVTVTFNLR